MAQNVVWFEGPRASVARSLRDRVERMASILVEIDGDELLSALPECPIDREAHFTALGLLMQLELELAELSEDIQALEAPRQEGRSISSAPADGRRERTARWADRPAEAS